MYYKKPIKEIYAELSASNDGLSTEEAKKRLEKYGPNKLREKKKISPLKLLIDQVKDPLIYILLAAALVTVFIEQYIDTAVIMAVVVINTIVGFFQEFKAEKAMEALKKLTAPKATAIRDGDDKKINASELIPGDIVTLSSGNKVPADVRIIKAKQLTINESMLTGESKPVEKSTEIIEEENLALADQANMAFMGTIVTQGRGKGVVVNTGQHTELGKISKQVSETEKAETPLQKRLNVFSRKIAFITLGLAILVILIGLIKDIDIFEMALFAISMAVGVIPAGLPIAATVAMAIGLNRMAKRNALIRRLEAVETLGSCNYICSDKTGTITENRMTVKQAYAAGNEYEFSGDGYNPEGEIKARHLSESGLEHQEAMKPVQEDDHALKKLLLCGLLCNNANLYREEGEWKVDGDPTEGSLLVSARKFGIDIDEVDVEYAQKDQIPFSSKRQYMATIHKKENGCYLFVKGSPEKILKFTNQENNEELRKHAEKMTNSGLRVLGFAVREFKDSCPEEIDVDEHMQSNLEFLGFQGIIDPPRQSAIEAIKDTKNAGITTVMITGDHKQTASSIAEKIGIFKKGDMAVTGQEIDARGEDFLNENIEKIRVYARVSPDHKIKIVEDLQNRGNVVAVTGDGVNDAPALKRAAIGISMGKVGTDVAKEASEMILRDDNFASIIEAVKEGRVIFDNIRKVSFFLLSSSAGVVLTIILALLFGLPLPFFATQVLWINLVTNGVQDVALAYEPAEKDVAKKPPRSPKEDIMNMFIFKRLLLVGVVMTLGALPLYIYKISQGASLEYARTTAVNTIVFFQFFHTLNCRSFDRSIFKMSPFSNPFLLISLSLSVLAEILFISYEPLQYVFSTTSLDAITWAQTILIPLSIIVVFEVDKYIRRKRQKQ